MEGDFVKERVSLQYTVKMETLEDFCFRLFSACLCLEYVALKMNREGLERRAGTNNLNEIHGYIFIPYFR